MTRSARLVLGLVATKLLAAAAAAQPLITKEDGVYARMPERVEVAADGTMSVVTRDVGPIPPGGAMPELSREIPILSQSAEGVWRAGIEVTVGPASSRYPVAVWPDETCWKVSSSMKMQISCYESQPDFPHDHPETTQLVQVRWFVSVAEEDPFFLRISFPGVPDKLDHDDDTTAQRAPLDVQIVPHLPDFPGRTP